MSNVVTVAELKAFKKPDGTTYNISTGGKGFTDDEIQLAINEAEELVEKITHQRWYSSVETWYLCGFDSKFLRFTPTIEYPLLVVTSLLEVDEDDNTVDTWVENTDFVNQKHYLLAIETDDNDRIGTITAQGSFPEGIRNFKLAGIWGTESCPKAVERVMKLMALESLSPGITYLSRSEISSKSWPDYSVTYRGGGQPSAGGTGFMELDRILHRYVNLAGLMLHDEMRAYPLEQAAIAGSDSIPVSVFDNDNPAPETPSIWYNKTMKCFRVYDGSQTSTIGMVP